MLTLDTPFPESSYIFIFDKGTVYQLTTYTQSPACGKTPSVSFQIQQGRGFIDGEISFLTSDYESEFTI